MFAKRASITVAAAALALAACGGDSDAERKRKDAIEKVVLDFAAADGREACDLLSVEGVEKVYGLDDAQPAYYNCVEASDKFEGETVDIDEIKLGEGDGATVEASTEDDSREYRVRVKRISGEWKITDIAEV